MSNKNQQCIYCGERSATTRDHVPPKCLFPKPRPDNLTSVPACASCNRNASRDEEYFLAVLMLTEAGITDAGKTIWSTLRRMYSRPRGLKFTIAASIEHIPEFTPSGIFFGQRLSVRHDDERFRLVVTKIVKGLYWFEYGQMFPKGARVHYKFLLTGAERKAALKYMPVSKSGTKTWPGVFEYRHNRVAERPEGSIWLFLFYGVAHFWIVTT